MQDVVAPNGEEQTFALLVDTGECQSLPTPTSDRHSCLCVGSNLSYVGEAAILPYKLSCLPAWFCRWVYAIDFRVDLQNGNLARSGELSPRFPLHEQLTVPDLQGHFSRNRIRQIGTIATVKYHDDCSAGS